MGSWLGPLVVVVAVALGGCALRCVDRFEEWRDARGSTFRPLSRAHATRIAEGIREGWESQGSIRGWK